MVSVNKIDGKYVASSIPKPLIIPIPAQGRKHLVQERTTSSDEYLYVLAKGRISTPSSRSKHLIAAEGDGIECPPVQGRHHVDIQTDLYLEEICDIVEETDQECQTDPLLDRPPSPLFVPAKIGVDVETQIWPGDLFDFDFEVQPVVEALVNQTIEQSLIELDAEDEFSSLLHQQKEFESHRNAEFAERLRLEEEERRLLVEQKKRIKEHEEALRLEQETAQKIAACVYAQHYLSNLLPTVYRRLESQGFFVAQDPLLQEIEEDFWPYFIGKVDEDITKIETSCYILDSLIEEAAQNVTATAVIRPITPYVFPEIVEESEGVEEEDKEDQGVADEENEDDDATD